MVLQSSGERSPLETKHHGKGPVHINVPISEPLFQFTSDALPEVRVITRYQG